MTAIKTNKRGVDCCWYEKREIWPTAIAKINKIIAEPHTLGIGVDPHHWFTAKIL